MKKIILLVCLAVFMIVVMNGCGKNKFVGTWDVPGSSISMIIQSDGTAFITMLLDAPKLCKWGVHDSRIIICSADNPKDAMFGTISADDNLQIFITSTATTPTYILTRRK